MSVKKDMKTILLKKITLTLLCINFSILLATNKKKFSIMIDPAGTTRYTGRIIDNTFERGITLQFVQELKKLLEKQIPTCKIMLSRSAGETISELQNAAFSNRLNVDLYLSIHFYQEQGVKPNLYLYQFSYNDEFITSWFDLAFYSYDQAYRANSTRTTQWINAINHELDTDDYKKQFDLKGPFKLPFRPLIGIKASGIALEASLKKNHDWTIYLEPIINGITSIIKQQS